MKLLSFFINSNIYVSLGAVCLTLETQVQLGMRPQWHPYIFIIFFATFFEYNLHRLITIITNKEALKNEKHSWVNNNLGWFYVLIALSVIGFGVAMALAKQVVLITLAPIALITVFYTFPFFKKKNNIVRLRDIPGLKIFLISFVWSAVTILLPIIQIGLTFNKGHVILMFIERSLFIFAITIPFDIRDMKVDAMAGTRTIPLLLGELRSLKLANLSLVVFVVLVFFHYIQYPLPHLIAPFFISALTTYFFLNSTKLKALKYYHYAILDGTIILQGILVCLAAISWPLLFKY